MKIEDLLEDVHDQETLKIFVRALADERAHAAKIERSTPNHYMVDGALNWKNADIASFLYAGLDYFQEKPFHKPEPEPSWRMFAEFLYFGKVIE